MRVMMPGRVARLLAVPLMAVMAASCLDGPTGPLTVGELRLLPTFTPGDDPAALGLTIDSMRVTATRPSTAAAVIDTVLPFAAGVTRSWILDLLTDPETFDATVELYGGSDTLYSGSVSAAIGIGFADGRPSNEVLLQYVGAPVTSPIAEIVVAPARVTLIAVGATQQFTAEARDASGAVIPGVTFGWSSSATSVATIGQGSGIATAASEGSTTITATAAGVSGSANLAVDLSGTVLAAITVTPASATLTSVGETQQFVATAQDAAGDPVVGATYAWASSNAAVASIDVASGMATAAAEGTTSISATAGGVTGTASLVVDLGGGGASIASIVVTPASATLTTIGATQQFTAEARDAVGQPIAGVVFTWSSSIAGSAAIDPATGLATAVGNGATTITATAGGVSGTASLTVDVGGGGWGIASIVVTPASATLSSLGAAQQFTAQAYDAGGNVIQGVVFSWSSDASSVAVVDAATGLATSVANGTANIIASAGGVSGSAMLQVAQQVARVVVAPDTARLQTNGETVQFTATALDGNDHPVAGVTFGWTSSEPLVASIDPVTGVATAHDGGIVTITATAQGFGVSGTAALLVRR